MTAHHNQRPGSTRCKSCTHTLTSVSTHRNYQLALVDLPHVQSSVIPFSSGAGTHPVLLSNSSLPSRRVWISKSVTSPSHTSSIRCKPLGEAGCGSRQLCQARPLWSSCSLRCYLLRNGVDPWGYFFIQRKDSDVPQPIMKERMNSDNCGGSG